MSEGGLLITLNGGASPYPGIDGRHRRRRYHGRHTVGLGRRRIRSSSGAPGATFSVSVM